VNVKDSPDSVPSVIVGASSPGIKEAPQPHSISSTDSGNRNHSSSSTSISSSTSPVNQVLHAPPQKTKSDFNHCNCLPDSTTCSVSSSSSQLASQNYKSTDACKMNHTASSSDQGYHSISSNGGGQVTASIGNESEVSGASSSCMYRSSPESLQYPPYSPQSVFSSDGSLPPPNNHALTHIDSPESSHSKPAQCGTTTVLHHPNDQFSSHVMTPVTQPVKQVIPGTPVTPMIPMEQVTPVTHQIHASGSYPQHLIHSHPIHVDNFAQPSSRHVQQPGHQLHAEGRRTVIGNGYGPPQFTQYNYSTVSRNEGANPGNFFPNSNTNQVGMAFVKTEPTSPPYYPPPYRVISGNPAPQPQGSAAIFTAGPHYLEGRGIHQQGVGTQMFTASATGKRRIRHCASAAAHVRLNSDLSKQHYCMLV
jgi:hypothetical protein